MEIISNELFRDIKTAFGSFLSVYLPTMTHNNFFYAIKAAISTTRPHVEIYSIPSLIFIVHLRPLCNRIVKMLREEKRQ